MDMRKLITAIDEIFLGTMIIVAIFITSPVVQWVLVLTGVGALLGHYWFFGTVLLALGLGGAYLTK